MNPSTFTVAAGWSGIGFAAYYFLASNNNLALKLWTGGKLDSGVRVILLQRIWGLIFLGIIPLLIIILGLKESPGNFGLSVAFIASPPWWSYLLIPVIIFFSHIQASSPSNLALYPQIRLEVWDPGTLFLSSLSWIAFLIGYEFMFRGFLLFASLQVMNVVPAFALNTALYALAHLYKGPGETFGAVPVGIVFCYLSMVTGNIWSAVILHAVMALSNEWFSIRSHPRMKFTRKLS